MYNSARVSVAALIWLICLASSSVQAQSGVLLRWKLKAGDAYNVEMTQNATQELDLGGPQSIQIGFTMRMSMVVDAAREHEFDVTQKIESIKFNIESPFIQMDYDSASGEEPDGQAAQMVAGFKPLLGLTIKQTINDRGESVKVEIDESKLADAKGNPMTARFVSKDSFRQLLSANGLIFPEQSISAGDSWDGKFKQDTGGMEMSTDSKFTFVGEEKVDGDSVAKITSTHQITMTPSENAEMSIELKSQNSSGEFLFDNTAGRLKSATIKQELGMGVEQGGMQMDIKTKSESKFALTPVSK